MSAGGSERKMNKLWLRSEEGLAAAGKKARAEFGSLASPHSIEEDYQLFYIFKYLPRSMDCTY